MPYTKPIHNPDTGKWCVYKENPDGSRGENAGCSDTEELAHEHLAALYASETTKADAPPSNPDDWAYTPDNEHPSTWKLRIDDPQHIAGAITALAPGGFEGQKVDIPSEDKPGVLRKISGAIDRRVDDPEQRKHLHERLDAVKAGRMISAQNADLLKQAMQHLLDVFQRAGITVESQSSGENANPADMLAAKYFDLPENERVIAYGSTIKAVGENRFGGHAVTWGNTAQKDLDGQYFTAQTDFWLKYFQPPRPFIYHHGLDAALGKTIIGDIDVMKADDLGLYVEGEYSSGVGNWTKQQLSLHEQYIQAIKELVRRGVIGFSTGSLSHLVSFGSDGEIKSWPVGEISGTPTPADQRGNRVYNLKSIKELIVDPLQVNQAEVPTDSDGMTSPQSIEAKAADVPTMDGILNAQDVVTPSEETIMDIKKMCEAALKALADAQIMLSPEQQQAFVAAMQQQYSNNGASDDAMAGKSAAEFAAEFVKTARQVAEQIKSAELVGTQMTAQLAAAPLVNDLPAPKVVKSNGATSIRVSSKYDRLSASDMAFVHRVMYSAILPGMKTEPMSQEYYRALADKIEKADKPVPENVTRAVKAIKSGEYRGMGYRVTSDPDAIKANELDYSTQSTGGDEWVPDLWDSTLWELMRLENKIASSMEAIDMPSNPYELPVQSTDPTVYFVPETTDETQLLISGSGNPIPDSKLATAKATLTAKKLALRVGYSTELDEDSIVPWATNLNAQAQRSMLNAIDNVLLNGDTQTGSTLNVNLVDSTPPATAKYLIFDGLRKQALVTTSTLSVDAGGVAPTLAAIRTARFKMRNAYAADPANLRLITDTSTYAKLLSMPEFITLDKAGPDATAQKGVLGFIDAIPVFVSNELPLVNTAGKVSNTAGNNTLGSIILFAPYGWKVGYRRRIKLTSEFVSWADSFQLTGTVRLAFINASTDSVAALYNLAV